MTWESKQSRRGPVDRSVGAGKIIYEAPVSDGTFADEIMNFSRTDRGFLENGLRLMPLIPDEWRATSTQSASSSGSQPEAFLTGVLAMKYVEMNGVSPELLIITNDGVFQFNPSLRADGTSNPGLQEQWYWNRNNTVTSVKPAGYVRFPPQMESVGNRIYFTFCDGASSWVWDGVRVRPFGFSQRPAPPDVEGPARGFIGSPNEAGFSVRGRVGTTDSSFTDEANTVMGGVDDGRWRYKVALEGPDGAISPSSHVGGEATMRLVMGQFVGTDSEDRELYAYEHLTRRFLLQNIDVGDTETAARYILRTRNLKRLPDGDFGDFFVVHRIPNNSATQWIDDTPDGELIDKWEDRGVVEPFYFMKFFSGSLFRMRSDGYPSRVWWSEQTGMFGPIPESSMASHWQDVYPSTGAITGGIVAPYASANVGSTLIIFKENATHYVSGEYPGWNFGTLHASAGCAGPGLAQAIPDGSVIWYGSGTFWRYTPDGKIVDIGGPLRKKLRKVNRSKARMGSSWIDRNYGEVVFALPVEDDSLSKMQFVFDYQVGGWRRKNFMSIRCAEILGASGMVVVGGSFENTESVFVLNRGYTGYSVAQPLAEYVTGWCAYDEFGPNVHRTTRTADIVLTMEERGLREQAPQVITYTEWDDDNAITTQTIETSHPESTPIAYYGTTTTSAEYGVAAYRNRRPFSQRIATDIPSSSVFKVHIKTYDELALANIDAYGSRLAGAASRTPTLDAED
tara:strand:+ start:22 stop:2229 length:2208 start_codon:yes stop_codon:yes gene_type:complete